MSQNPNESHSINWDALVELASTTRSSESYAQYTDDVREAINKTLPVLAACEDWKGIVRLRKLFEFLGGGETLGLGPVLGHLNKQAIVAAQRIGDHSSAGQFLYDEGDALHRQGKHLGAIQAFEQSAKHRKLIGDDFRARDSYFMTALCHRALGNRKLAREIIQQVLNETGDSLWRAHPLAVLSWLQQDEEGLEIAEVTMREATSLFGRLEGPDSVMVGQCLADLGELVGFQHRYTEAEEIFEYALTILAKQPTPDARLIARTLLKKAEVHTRKGELDEGMRLLRQAYLTIAEAQYNDLMWRIQLAMAEINLQQKDYAELVKHIRLALKHRRAIGLSDWALVKQYLARKKMGTGLPR